MYTEKTNQEQVKTDQLTKKEIKAILEAILFVSHEPITTSQMVRIFGGAVEPRVLQSVVEELKSEYKDQEKGICIVSVAGGYQLCTAPEYAPWLKQFIKEEKARRLSHAALETLAITAYNQPVTRMDIEKIRGVSSGEVVDNLVSKGLVEMKGRKSVPGNPYIYGTTDKFLEYFGLATLNDLPDLSEIQEFKDESESVKK